MALSDYITEKTEEKVAIPFASPAMANQSANALTMADIQMATAEKAAQNRTRAEELKKKIANLKAQNDQLRARRDQIKANSLSDMDEDKVVAMAKAKGIKNDDIEAWLRGRTARTNREISLGQKASLEAQEREMAEANRQNAEQAIFDAQAELVAAEKAVPDEQLREQDAIVKAKRNKFERLKRDYEKAYNVRWEDVSGQDGKTDDPDKKSPQNAQEGPKNVVVELTDEQIGVLDEPTLAKYNEPTATNETKRRIKAEADKKIREKNEADKARQKKLAAIKADMATLGIKSAGDVSKVLGNFKKSPSRNDKVKVGAFNRIMEFAKNDKEYNSYPKLGELLGNK